MKVPDYSYLYKQDGNRLKSKVIIMKINQRVKTALGTGIFLGYECFDRVDGKEIMWRVESDTDNKNTTGRKAVKLDKDVSYLKDNIAYFFKHDDLRVIEFSVGDVVTFKAYDEEIKAKVVEVLEDGYLFNGEPHYKLSGISEALLSYTTGKSIKESIYFDNTPFSFSN